MSFTIGQSVQCTLFGQSHAANIGGVLDGLPAGERIDLDAAQAFLRRRAPGTSPLSTARREADVPQILSGLVDGHTVGAPLAFCIANADARSADYALFRTQPRPAHADYPAHAKFGDAHDIRGGGFFSARLTAALCFAGAVAIQILARRGVQVGAHIAAIAGMVDAPYDPVQLTADALACAGQRDFPVNDPAQGATMQEAILAAKRAGDSVGGVVECAVLGLPAGVGAPIFDSLESLIAHAAFAIPALKGIEFGAGFALADMRGSQANDPYISETDGLLRTKTNHNGGILGGLSTGMPLVFRAAFKPTPSIAAAQQTWNSAEGQVTQLQIPGRHDPCVVPRAVPCVEAAAALAILDAIEG
ncbi:MAG: chorismate synthase [Oscillospiraceae bacterium]|jgi:chorismate synthase|nr:chorismate synthase [Oscillospiraceae bacterium]